MASFLQRMGRTGRRPDTVRNCLFLATHDYSLLQAAALLNLWSEGFVEAVEPPTTPYHVFVQQLLALVLQNPGFVRSDWVNWIGKVPAFAELKDGRADEIIEFAVCHHLLGEDGGILHLGSETERQLGHRHFSELLSVVASQPLFQVRFGRHEIGFVHPLSFSASKKLPTILALGGRGWKILHLDWNRKIAHVEPTQETGRSRWLASSVALSSTLCGAIHRLLQSSDQDHSWSRRAAARIGELRHDLAACCGEGSAIIKKDNSVEWWTFAGLAVNQTIVQYVQPYVDWPIHADNLWIGLPSDQSVEKLIHAINELRHVHSLPDWDFQRPAGNLLKFANLLPEHLLHELVISRNADVPRAKHILDSLIRNIVTEAT